MKLFIQKKSFNLKIENKKLTKNHHINNEKERSFTLI